MIPLIDEVINEPKQVYNMDKYKWTGLFFHPTSPLVFPGTQHIRQTVNFQGWGGLSGFIIHNIPAHFHRHADSPPAHWLAELTVYLRP